MKLIFLTLSMVISQSIFAIDHHVTRITNDYYLDEIEELSIEMNDETLEAKMIHVDTFDLEGSFLVRKSHLIDQINKNGVVLLHKKGRDVIKLEGKNIDLVNGGEVKIVYMTNGITRAIKSLSVELLPENGAWSLYYQDKKVSRLHFIVRRVRLFGVVGIKNVTPYDTDGNQI